MAFEQLVQAALGLVLRLALLETGLRTASVIASTELSMLVVARRDFERVLDALPTAAARVRRVALDRLIGLR